MPKTKIDLSPVSAALQQLESIFHAAAATRKQLDDVYGNEPNQRRTEKLAALRSDADDKLYDARGAVETAFSRALAQAADNRDAARRDFAASPDGMQYLQGLSGFAALAARMTPDQIADRLNGALDARMVGAARAWSEVAETYYAEAASPQLGIALYRAQREAVPEGEAAANAELAYVQSAKETYTAFTATIPSRTSEAIEYGNGAQGAGNFLPVNILGD